MSQLTRVFWFFLAASANGLIQGCDLTSVLLLSGGFAAYPLIRWLEHAAGLGDENA